MPLLPQPLFVPTDLGSALEFRTPPRPPPSRANEAGNNELVHMAPPELLRVGMLQLVAPPSPAPQPMVSWMSWPVRRGLYHGAPMRRGGGVQRRRAGPADTSGYHLGHRSSWVSVGREAYVTGG